jgi:hypothetical protein
MEPPEKSARFTKRFVDRLGDYLGIDDEQPRLCSGAFFGAGVVQSLTPDTDLRSGLFGQETGESAGAQGSGWKEFRCFRRRSVGRYRVTWVGIEGWGAAFGSAKWLLDISNATELESILRAWWSLCSIHRHVSTY